MDELTKYITDKLENLALKTSVINSTEMLKVTITKPFVQEITVIPSEGEYYWTFTFDTSPAILVCTNDMVEKLLDKQSIYRSWGKNTDKGMMAIIRGHEVYEKPSFNGRFSIGVEIKGTTYVYDQPFIDHWRYILMGIEKYGM